MVVNETTEHRFLDVMTNLGRNIPRDKLEDLGEY